ncbi:hypothetical protein B0J13DRAFT_566487 [Dactylonectria estremocensis]|uniref:Uncharacterized protein n=1 Tax=Dactylonectria estremocensis TaxID=1079267 RepID=A0A9P9DPM7_9HYPO|nr:hypothetical protein B0J13DRAFT_566487 [Dactylonectria estremocensis]
MTTPMKISDVTSNGDAAIPSISGDQFGIIARCPGSGTAHRTTGSRNRSSDKVSKQKKNNQRGGGRTGGRTGNGAGSPLRLWVCPCVLEDVTKYFSCLNVIMRSFNYFVQHIKRKHMLDHMFFCSNCWVFFHDEEAKNEHQRSCNRVVPRIPGWIYESELQDITRSDITDQEKWLLILRQQYPSLTFWPPSPHMERTGAYLQVLSAWQQSGYRLYLPNIPLIYPEELVVGADGYQPREDPTIAPGPAQSNGGDAAPLAELQDEHEAVSTAVAEDGAPNFSIPLLFSANDVVDRNPSVGFSWAIAPGIPQAANMTPMLPDQAIGGPWTQDPHHLGVWNMDPQLDTTIPFPQDTVAGPAPPGSNNHDESNGHNEQNGYTGNNSATSTRLGDLFP